MKCFLCGWFWLFSCFQSHLAPLFFLNLLKKNFIKKYKSERSWWPVRQWFLWQSPTPSSPCRRNLRQNGCSARWDFFKHSVRVRIIAGRGERGSQSFECTCPRPCSAAAAAARCQRKLPARACATSQISVTAWRWYTKNKQKKKKIKKSRKIDIGSFSLWVWNAAYFRPVETFSNGEELCSHAYRGNVSQSRCEWAGVFTEMPSVGACMCVQYASVCVCVFISSLSSERSLRGGRGWAVSKTKKTVRLCFCSGFLFICLLVKCKKNKQTSTWRRLCVRTRLSAMFLPPPPTSMTCSVFRQCMFPVCRAAMCERDSLLHMRRRHPWCGRVGCVYAVCVSEYMQLLHAPHPPPSLTSPNTKTLVLSASAFKKQVWNLSKNKTTVRPVV